MSKQTAAFRQLLAEHGGSVEALPRDAAGYGLLLKYDPVQASGRQVTCRRNAACKGRVGV